jgi:16S rRNA (cytosine967-C5)-methyltransferase
VTGLAPRRLALDILAATAEGRRPEDLLAARLPELQKPEDRHLVSHLVYGTLRWQGRLDWIIDFFVKKPGNLSPLVRLILRLGLFQIIFLDRIPDHAAVDTAVGLARSREKRAAGLVNAVLRNYRRQENAVTWPADPIERLAATRSLPAWLARQWIEIFGPDEAAAMAEAQTQEPPLNLRANTLRTTRDELVRVLTGKAREMGPGRYSPEAVIIRGPQGPPTDWPEYGAGLFALQDEAAQLVSHLGGPRPGETVVDLCAGRGGKTFHVAALMGDRGTIHAWDKDEGRATELARNKKTLGVHCVRPLTLDATAADLPEVKADLVLVDAPCTGLGVIRRRPDIKWRVFRDDPAKMAGLQSRLLEVAAGLVRPGGRLVYAVCTLTEAEGPEVVRRFIEKNPEFEVQTAEPYLPEPARSLVDKQGFLVTWPHRHGLDGFFAVRLIRIA